MHLTHMHAWSYTASLGRKLHRADFTAVTQYHRRLQNAMLNHMLLDNDNTHY